MTTLSLVTDTTPATDCPAWCCVDHTDPNEDRDYHYSDLIPAGPVTLRLDTDTAGVTTLELVTEHAEGDRLDLNSLDALRARLGDLRPALAAATLPAGAR